MSYPRVQSYSPEQYGRAVELWKRLVENPLTSLKEDAPYVGSYLQEIADEHLYSLIMSDGEETSENFAVTVSLISCSDLGGSDQDAANVIELSERYGDWVSILQDHGPFSQYEAWLRVGELPPGSNIDESLDELERIANDMDGLTEYGLLSEETHSKYVDELAGQAWDAYLRSDIQGELADLDPTGTFETWDDVLVVNDPRDPDNIFREAYYAYEGNEWTCERATSVTNGRHKDAVIYAAREAFGWDI